VKISVAVMVCFLTLGSAVAFGGSFDVAGPPAAGVDTDPPTSVSLLISGFGGEIVTDVGLRVAISGGGWASDIDVTLSHNGVSVLAFDATTDSVSVMDAVFDDAAGGGAPKSGDIIGTFTPDNPLSAFDGRLVNGTWTLTLHDQLLPGDGESLTSWSIFGTTAVPEPGTITLFGLGLMGFAAFAVRRRRRRKT
jgi:hypothetical protein